MKDVAAKYTESDMRVCILEWCMWTNPCMNLDSIITAHCNKTGKKVSRQTLYTHFAKVVDLGSELGGLTNLKETQAFARAKPKLSSTRYLTPRK